MGWWEAELEEAARQLTEIVDSPSSWTPAHLVYDSALKDDWDELYGESSLALR